MGLERLALFLRGWVRVSCAAKLENALTFFALASQKDRQGQS